MTAFSYAVRRLVSPDTKHQGIVTDAFTDRITLTPTYKELDFMKRTD